MKRYNTWLVALVAVPVALAAQQAMAIEEAEYSVIRGKGDIEIREYAPSIVAETIVFDDFEDAGNAAFRKLFDYISGNNVAREEIAMTAPVSQEKKPEKISMTAPVAQRTADGGWAVSFMMPAAYTMETIPEPKDPDVVLRYVPSYRAAAIRYSGFWSEKRFQQHLEELRTWMAQNGLEAAGEPVWARYNAPFTPWFMRRNEILIPLAEQ